MKIVAKPLDALGILLLGTFVATAAGLYFNVPARRTASPPTTLAAKYHCPMHPGMVAQRPGDCPQCGMALVAAAKSGATPTAVQHHDACEQPADGATPARAGCNHAEAAAGGGCCSEKIEPAAGAAPSGCTRVLPPRLAGNPE